MTRRPAAMCVMLALLVAACGDATTSGDAVSATGTSPSPIEPTTAFATPDAVQQTPSAGPAVDPDPSTEGETLQFDQKELALPATGTLGVENLEGGCIYLEVDGQKYELLAGPDAALAMDAGNGVVADAEGNVIAQAGDTITVEGALDPGIATFCQIGPVLMATSVAAA